MARTNERTQRTNARLQDQGEISCVPSAPTPVDKSSSRVVKVKVRRELCEAIAPLHALGYSAKEIAVRVGCSSRTVTRWRSQAGVAQHLPEGAARPVSAVKLRAAAVLLADGASYAEVSRTVHIAKDTLKRHLPGYTYTAQQSAEVAAIARKLRSL